MVRELDVITETDISFWARKKPCWEMCHCPESVKNQCPAPKYHFLPCWEIEGTYLKLSDDGCQGNNNQLCRVCRVYKTYGHNEDIDIKLRGRGLDTQFKELNEKVEMIRG